MPNLLLCMTPGVGLNTWKNIGSLDRELMPYVEYVKRGFTVRILTFDSEKTPRLPKGIEAIRFGSSKRLILLPWLMRGLGAWADIIKTNQSNGAYYYAFAARQWKKPLILRCGYVQGEYLETTKGRTAKVMAYQRLEAWAFKSARHSLVPTKALSEWVNKKYGISNDRISIIPNFIDTSLFRPIKGIIKKERSVVSVGRLAPVKRFDLLIKACAGISGCELTLAGEGPEKENLKTLAQSLGVNLTLTGNVPNEKLPKLIQEHGAFAMTSLREGHPKALIEAMACGMPCIAVKARGTENLIEHMKTGLLVKGDAMEVKNGLELLFSDAGIASSMSENARRFASTNYDFECIISKEIGISEGILKALAST